MASRYLPLYYLFYCVVYKEARSKQRIPTLRATKRNEAEFRPYQNRKFDDKGSSQQIGHRNIFYMRFTNMQWRQTADVHDCHVQTEGNGSKILENTDTKTRTVQFSVNRAKVTLFCGSGTAQTPKYCSFVFLIIPDLGVFVIYIRKSADAVPLINIGLRWAAAKIFSYSF